MTRNEKTLAIVLVGLILFLGIYSSTDYPAGKNAKRHNGQRAHKESTDTDLLDFELSEDEVSKALKSILELSIEISDVKYSRKEQRLFIQFSISKPTLAKDIEKIYLFNNLRESVQISVGTQTLVAIDSPGQARGPYLYNCSRS